MSSTTAADGVKKNGCNTRFGCKTRVGLNNGSPQSQIEKKRNLNEIYFYAH